MTGREAHTTEEHSCCCSDRVRKRRFNDRKTVHTQTMKRMQTTVIYYSYLNISIDTLIAQGTAED